MDPLIRIACLKDFFDFSRENHINPNNILKSVGIFPSQLQELNTFISYQSFIKALVLASQESDNDSFALELSVRQKVQTLGLVGAYMSRQTTILDALNVAKKYMFLHVEGLSFSYELLPNEQCLLEFNSPLTHHEVQESQSFLGTSLAILKDLVGNKFKLERVMFKQAKPKNSAFFHKLFACPIEFNAEKDGFIVFQSTLNLKPKANDFLVDAMLFDAIQQQKPNFKSAQYQQIINMIKSLLATGDCNKNHVALCMQWHPKKLQRFLTEQGTTFRELIEDVRKKEAVKLLENSRESVTTIALKLGYSELSVFSRKFKTWYGVSPSVWRE